MPTIPVFVDTNVLLYAASTNPSEADKRDAARAILVAGDYGFSVQVAQEFFVNATGKLKPPLSSADAMKFLQKILPVEVVGLDFALFVSRSRAVTRTVSDFVLGCRDCRRCQTLWGDQALLGRFGRRTEF